MGYDAATITELKSELTTMAVDRQRMLGKGATSVCSVDWLGASLTVPAGDCQLQWSLALAAHVKHRLIMESQEFVRLPWEAVLFPPALAEATVQVHLGLVKPYLDDCVFFLIIATTTCTIAISNYYLPYLYYY